MGWEFFTLTADPRRYPTMSAVVHYFWRFREVQIASYGLWLWLGWDIVFDRTRGPAPWLRSRLRTVSGRVVLVIATLALGWWVTGLPHNALRWIALALPAAVLALAAWGVEHRTEPPAEWLHRSRVWARRHLRRAHDRV